MTITAVFGMNMESGRKNEPQYLTSQICFCMFHLFIPLSHNFPLISQNMDLM